MRVENLTLSPSASFARPNDANPYIAKDVVADSTSTPTIMKFANVVRGQGSSGTITGVRVETDNKLLVARLRLWLFNAADPVLQGDNAPMLWLYANQAKRIGYLDIAPFTTEDPTNSTGAFVQDDTIRKWFKCASGLSDIWAVAETLDAFTPTNNQNFFFQLQVVPD